MDRFSLATPGWCFHRANWHQSRHMLYYVFTAVPILLPFAPVVRVVVVVIFVICVIVVLLPLAGVRSPLLLR
jgi:hypothetical protein